MTLSFTCQQALVLPLEIVKAFKDSLEDLSNESYFDEKSTKRRGLLKIQPLTHRYINPHNSWFPVTFSKEGKVTNEVISLPFSIYPNYHLLKKVVKIALKWLCQSLALAGQTAEFCLSIMQHHHLNRQQATSPIPWHTDNSYRTLVILIDDEQKFSGGDFLFKFRQEEILRLQPKRGYGILFSNCESLHSVESLTAYEDKVDRTILSIHQKYLPITQLSKQEEKLMSTPLTNMTIENLQIVSPAHPVLSQVAEELSTTEITSQLIQSLIAKMKEIAGLERGDPTKKVLVGLAAPQIGVAKRIILVDPGADGKGKITDVHVYINPEITERSKETNEWYEACYSTVPIAGIVSRANRVTITALNEKGQTVTETHDGYTARIFQHEIDHLHGQRFPSLIENEQNLHVVQSEEFPAYRNQEGWRNWPTKCTQAEWQAIQKGAAN